jgi:mono/diheme cytochrome c family protein
MMKRLNRLALLTGIPVLITILAVVNLLSACVLPGRLSSFKSNGEEIYFTGDSSSGDTISYSGGFTMMHQRTTCANCHGPEGRGGKVTMMMMRRFDVPDITWDKLTQEEHHEEKQGQEEHEEHPPYTEETLRRAITKGIDPAGEPLDKVMPHWQMSERDLDDLVEFMKTLE